MSLKLHQGLERCNFSPEEPLFFLAEDLGLDIRTVLGDSQLSVTAASRDLMPSSGSVGTVLVCICLPHSTHKRLQINAKSFKNALKVQPDFNSVSQSFRGAPLYVQESTTTIPISSRAKAS